MKYSKVDYEEDVEKGMQKRRRNRRSRLYGQMRSMNSFEDGSSTESGISPTSSAAEDEHFCCDERSCPVTHAVVSSITQSRFKNMRYPLLWISVHSLLTYLFVWALVLRYTQKLCTPTTEFINAGRIINAGRRQGWVPPPLH